MHYSTRQQNISNDFIPGSITTEFQELITKKLIEPTLIGSKVVPQQIAVFIKASASTTTNLTSGNSIPENSSPLKSAQSNYLQISTKAAAAVSTELAIVPIQFSTTTTNTLLTVIEDHQYSKLNAKINKVLSAAEQK